MPVTATPIPTSPVSGQYAAQSDIEAQFGVNNVRVWSQLDNSVTTADESRIQQALNFADARIISTFAGFGNYVTPLAPLGTDAALVTHWAAILAGAWLYQSRGLRDDDSQKDHVSLLLSDVVAQMLRYRAAEKLNAARRWPAATAPVGW